MTWLLKFVSGFAIWKSDKLGKILWVVAIILIVGGPIFFFVVKAMEKKIVNLERYVNCTVVQNHPTECPKEPAFEFIKLWRLRLFSVR